MTIRKKALTKKQKIFVEAFEKTAGNVSKACKSIKIDRSTFYLWMKPSVKLGIINTFPQKIEDARESFIDFAESSLYRGIKDGNTAMTIFYLKTKGKSRGYVETTEQIIEAKVSTKLDVSTLTDEQLRVLASINA